MEKNKKMITIRKYHDICSAHRVMYQGGKCERGYHGHNYRIHFTCTGEVNEKDGMILDFGKVSKILCDWLEENWDHKTILWSEDPYKDFFLKNFPEGSIEVGFNPTAENMAEYLLKEVGPEQLKDYPGVKLVKVRVEETAKCYAEASL